MAFLFAIQIQLYSKFEDIIVIKVMKLLQILSVYVLLCQTSDAGKIVSEIENRSACFSVEAIWRSYRTCTCEEPWKKGVQEFYDGCRTVANKFNGTAFEMADTTVNAIKQLITKLIDHTNSNSTILVSSATNTLISISRCNNLNTDSLKVIKESDKVFGTIVQDFVKIAGNLSPHIGDRLTCSFTNAINAFGDALSKYMKDFLQSCQLSNCERSVDLKVALKKYQELTNIVAFVDDTLLNSCSTNTNKEVYESVLVLHSLYVFMGITLNGITSCVLDILYARDCYVSERIKSCSLSFEYVLVETVQAICDVLVTSVASIRNLLEIFVNIAAALNQLVKDVLGIPSKLLIAVGVENVLGGDQGLSGILKGVLGGK